MIVDVHTYIWQTADQIGQADLGVLPTPAKPVGRRGVGHSSRRRIPPADPELHWQNTRPVDRAIVLAFKSRLLRAEVPNAFVSDYVKRHPEKLIGFASIDPTDERALGDLDAAHGDLGLRGAVVSPSQQAFHPADSRAMAVYREAEARRMPVVFQTGGHLAERARLEFARPVLIDEVARAFPKLPILIAGCGQPWMDETILLIAKHRHVYADVGGLLARPWQAFQALVAAHEHGVIDKLLFGSGFPFADAADCIERLYSLNLMVQGTGLPTVPRSALRGIVERDALRLLGLE